MKKNFLFVIGALIIGFTACEPEEIDFDSSADVFTITKTVGTGTEVDTLYGFALHVFANKSMTSVSASPDDGTNVTYQLEPYDGYTYDFYYETPEADFSTELPYVGKYDFNILAESGESALKSDNLSDDFIYPTDVLEYAYDEENNKHVLTWNEIDDADYIVIKLFDTEENLVFSNPQSVKGDKETYTIPVSSGWVNGAIPEPGDQFVLDLSGYAYEAGQIGVNLQSKSINLKTITWGGE